MSRTLIFCLLAFLACSTSAIPAAAPVRPPAGGVKVTSLEVDLDGGGCKPGEASVSIVRDNSALTIIFDNFEAADGPKAGSAKSRAFCRITIGVNSPGYALDIDTVDFRGYMLLEKGVEASLVSRWKWVDKNGIDLKGKASQTSRLPEVAALTASRGMFKKLFKGRLTTMCCCTRMVSYQTTSRQCARRKTQNYRSVFPQQYRQVPLRRMDMSKEARKILASGRF